MISWGMKEKHPHSMVQTMWLYPLTIFWESFLGELYVRGQYDMYVYIHVYALLMLQTCNNCCYMLNTYSSRSHMANE